MNDLELIDRIVVDGRVLARVIEALDTMEATGPFERALGGFVQAGYKRWLRAVVGEVPAWVMEEMLSASGGIGERWAMLWASEN